MATTSDVILDRVRSLCIGPPFYWTEATSSESFALDAMATAATGAFRATIRGSTVRGGTGYSEERTDSVSVEVQRTIDADYDATRRALHRAANSLTTAIIRDGHETSGDYAVPDAGRVVEVIGTPGAAFLTLRLTVPVLYESQV